MQNSRKSLSDPERWAELQRKALLDSPVEESFDRLTRFAARLLHAPVALISLVDEDRQLFMSQCGLPEPWASEREAPLSHSFCQHVVASAEPLIIENARQYALVKDSLAIPDLGLEAYLGVPICSPGGHVLGSFCVIDHEPRSWTEEDLKVLQEMAAWAMTEIELHIARADLRQRVQEKTEEVQHGERYFRALVENISDAVTVLGPDGSVQYVSPSFERITGYSAEERAGRSAFDRVHPDDLEAVGEAFQQLVEEPGAQAEIQPRLRHKDGRWRVVQLIGQNLLNDPAVGGIVITYSDVTERTEAKEALRESERRLSTLIGHLPGVVYRSRNDSSWTTEYVGGRTQELLGYTPEALTGEGGISLGSLIHPEDQAAVWQEVQAALAAQEPFQLGYRIRAAGGEEKWIWEQGEGIFSADGEVEALEGFLTDVTELKQAEERERQLALETSAREHAEATQQQVQDILESITDGFYALDEQWRVTYANQEVLDLIGKQGEEVLGKSLWELYPTPPESRLWTEFRRAVEEKAPIELEEYDPNTGLWARVRAYPREEGLTVYVRDVTSRKRAEAEADLEQRRLRVVLDALPVGVFIADASGRITRTNAAAEQIWGADELPFPSSPDEYDRYKGWWPGTGRPVQPHEWGMARALAGESVDEEEVGIETFGGARRTILNYARPIYDDAGEQVGAVAAIVDITERKEAAEALHESEITMEAILDASPDIVEMLDLEGRFRWVSPAMQSVLGYDVDDVEGRPMQDLLPPGDQEAFESSLRQLADGGAEEVRLRYAARHRDGHWVRMEGRGRAVRNEALRGLVLVARDVTEQEQLLASLQAAKEEAEAASRAKSEMLSRTSHELRTPMNAILGFAQILEMDVKREEDREGVEQILRAGYHLLSLVDEVLDIAEAESGRMALSLEPVHLPEVLEEVLSVLSPLARREKVELAREVAVAGDVRVLADRQRLKQVLLNLLSNAIKYNREGGRVDVTCEVLERDRLRIEVRDTGPGLTPERLSRLFRPFERAGAERTEVEGTGLGLTLSKALVEAMGGEIGARSTPGEGSTFWLELPRDAPKEQLAREGEQPIHASGVADEKAEVQAVVLYIEDVLTNVRLVERIFRRRPEVELITAARGEGGLELARERRPDLILLDLNLPDFSGEEVLQMLREDAVTREIPVVIISGDATSQQIETLLEAGARDYLAKPLSVPRFLQLVEEILGRREM